MIKRKLFFLRNRSAKQKSYQPNYLAPLLPCARKSPELVSFIRRYITSGHFKHLMLVKCTSARRGNTWHASTVAGDWPLASAGRVAATALSACPHR